MSSVKRICKCCGNTYEYCNRCSKYASQPKWRWKCDTEECNELFDVIAGYKMEINTIDDIKNVIEKYEIQNFSKYVDSITNILNELFGNTNNNKKSKKNKKKEMDIELKETNTVEETINEEIKEDVIISEENNDLLIDNSVDTILDFNGISDLM